MASNIILTGIKPTGEPHLGNYLGAIQPAVEMAKKNPNEKKYFFIADYHALTTIKDPQKMMEYRYQVAATWMAFFSGIDNCYFYFQSQIPEIFELYWILSCFCPKGLLNRAHAYKAIVAKNSENGHDQDRQINQGIFSYPVLMAADILLFHATKIPIGPDQKQHVEIAIEIVKSLNNILTNKIPVPEPMIDKANDIIIGIDGQKMSKNYNNTLPLFANEGDLKKRIGKIQTDSTPLGEPLQPDGCNVFKLFSYISSTSRQDELKKEYLSGDIGYGHAKQYLLEAYQTYFEAPKKQFDVFMCDKSTLDNRLKRSSKEVTAIAKGHLEDIKKALGMA
ncbi:tryptophan--tRNA ligase [Candidatus Marinamargulisbacteria bacterium SCGC AG-343-K17]|nr:tryptophan--tRNA ligase [Candidatus Marinamargulisbacteria bacterium SCGC AG-343-K17]